MVYQKVDRNYLLADLRQQVVEIAFHKQDGTLRVMRCSLHPSRIPPQFLDENRQLKQDDVNLNNLTVWDVEADDFRVISLNRVLSMQAVNTA